MHEIRGFFFPSKAKIPLPEEALPAELKNG